MDDAAAWTERTLALARAVPGLDAVEVRADVRTSVRHVFRNGAFTVGRDSRVAGIGVRAFVGGGMGYAYANELTEASLRDVVDRVARLARANAARGWKGYAPALASNRARYRPDVKLHPIEADHGAIVDLLRRAEDGARAVANDAATQVAFGSRSSAVVSANSAGGWVESESLLSTLLVQTTVRRDGRVGSSAEWRGGERGLTDYEDEGGPQSLGEKSGRLAVESLDAVSIPAGRYRALCDNHLTGLLAHESFGHLTEYDLVDSGWSVLAGRLGETLAAPSVTIRDAPVVPGRQGVAVPLDEEGAPGRPVTLLDRGVLSGYMHTRDSATSLGLAPTGNGRALDVTHPPIVRMRNTYVEPGELTFDEALEQLGDGVYLLGARGGAPRCDGSFLFTSKRGYLVEKGQIAKPIAMASIHGNVLDFLQGVEGLTRDFEVHTNFFGGCGKWDQSFLHVGTGGPHVVVREALVGGQGA